MDNWNDVHNGDKVCSNDGSILECVEWRGEKYLAGIKDMWNVSEFDPEDWEKMPSPHTDAR